jgi:hypothetical protein
MALRVAQVVATVVEGYALVGLVFSVLFLPRGILRVDERLRASPVTVRVLLLPGVAALWPLFAWRWIAGTPIPIERNAHRDAVRPSEEGIA